MLRYATKALLILLLFPVSGWATTNYVSPTGTATWAASENIATPCSLATANANLDDDDIAILAAGTYSTGFNPTNSGSNGFTNPITYTVASGATVIIRANRCIDLTSGQDSIKIQKGDGAALILDDPGYRYIDALGNSYITIDGITTTGADSNVAYYTNQFTTTRYLVIKNSRFESDDSTTDRSYDFVCFSDVKWFDIGPNNYFGKSPHCIVYITKSCSYGRIHGNTFANHWRHGLNFENILTITGADNLSPRNIIVEDNFFDKCGSLSTSNPWSTGRGLVTHAMEHGGSLTITRNNVFDRGQNDHSFFCKLGWTVEDNWYYHNTTYKPTQYVNDQFAGVHSRLNNYGTLRDNKVLNNVFSSAQGDYTWRWLDQGGSESGNEIYNNIVFPDTAVRTFFVSYFGSNYSSMALLEAGEDDWHDNVNADPLLTDPTGGDFTLDTGSPGLASAVFLAKIAVDGVSGTTFTLGTNEAYAFAPSVWGGSSIPNFTGDTIYNQDGDSAVVTGRVAHNQITVDDATGFEAGDDLTVYAFTGAAPHIGINATVDPTPPDEPTVASYLGWFTSYGTPTTNPYSDIQAGGDRTYLRKITPGEAGNAYSIRVWIDNYWTGSGWVVAYKMNGTTLEIIGSASIGAQTTNAWTSEIVLDSPGSFQPTDDIYFGVVLAPTTANSMSVGRNESGGDGLYYSIKDVTTGPHEELLTADMATPSLTRDMAFVFGYTEYADTTAPEIAITTETGNTSESSITIEGTATDNVGITQILWVCAQSEYAGTATIDGGTWSFNAYLIDGDNTITVTALDGMGNQATDSVVITHTPPTNIERIKGSTTGGFK